MIALSPHGRPGIWQQQSKFNGLFQPAQSIIQYLDKCSDVDIKLTCRVHILATLPLTIKTMTETYLITVLYLLSIVPVVPLNHALVYQNMFKLLVNPKRRCAPKLQPRHVHVQR